MYSSEHPEPILFPPEDTFRDETLWNFTFECVVQNISSDVGIIMLDVLGGEIYDKNQITTVNTQNLTDVVLVVSKF